MQFKIEIDGEESFYSFSDDQSIIIGRSPESDIQLLVEGISRSHAEIHFEGDEIIYTDLGSSMGSFINNDQLIANIPTVFNSFFPIRLGNHVLISIVDEVLSAGFDISDDLNKEYSEHKVKESLVDISNLIEEKIEEREKLESSKPKKNPLIYIPESVGTITEDASRIMSNKIPKKDKKKKVIKKEIQKKRKKVDTSQKLLIFLFVCIIAGFFGYKKWEEIEKKNFLALKAQMEADKIAQIAKAKKEEEEKRKLEEERLKEIERDKLRVLKGMVSMDKCIDQLESNLCKALEKIKPRSRMEGFYKTLETLYFVLNDDNNFQYFSNLKLEYLPAEEAEVLILARKYGGYSFHEGFFKLKSNLVLKPFEKNREESNLFLFSAFIRLLTPDLISKIQGVDQIVIIGISNKQNQVEIEDSFIIDFNKFRQKSLIDLKFLTKIYIRSNIDRPLKEELNKLKYTSESL